MGKHGKYSGHNRRVVNMAVLPGQPMNETGRVCIHLFLQDDSGPFTEPYALHPVFNDDGTVVKQQVEALATRGRLACDRGRAVAPVVHGNVTKVTSRTDDPRAVTCYKCKATAEYAAMMEKYNNGA